MKHISWISKDLFCSVDYKNFNDFNSGWKEVIPLRKYFGTTYKVPNHKGTGPKYYFRYWEDIFTHFPFISSCKINILLNHFTHKCLSFKCDIKVNYKLNL